VDRIKEELNRLGIEWTEEQMVLLDRYIQELLFWNPKYGLVKIENPQELEQRHIVDSLAPLNHIKALDFHSLADLGSGPGLPGIPLAIFLPQKEIYLVERSGKRVRFLRSVLVKLGLKNVSVLDQSLERVNQTFDLITFRAFRPFSPDILEGVFKIMKPESWVCAYKGKREVLEEEIRPFIPLIRNKRVESLDLPGGERHLLLFQKGE